MTLLVSRGSDPFYGFKFFSTPINMDRKMLQTPTSDRLP